MESETELVDTVKLALVAPAGTVTPEGKVATEALLVESATVAPAAGASAESVTVPVVAVPAVAAVGFRPIAARVVDGGTVSTADAVKAAYVAEIVTDVEADAEFTEIVNVALAAPAGTITVAGTVATAGLLLERAITPPPSGAAVASITVPVE
jgi:hypothetical protein